MIRWRANNAEASSVLDLRHCNSSLLDGPAEIVARFYKKRPAQLLAQVWRERPFQVCHRTNVLNDRAN
jgi:hypothetical protein